MGDLMLAVAVEHDFATRTAQEVHCVAAETTEGGKQGGVHCCHG